MKDNTDTSNPVKSPHLNTKREIATERTLCARMAAIYAERFARTLANLAKSHLALDYSRESIVEIDGWLKAAREWAGYPDTMSPIRRELFSSCGCYFGEAIIRQLGGHWLPAEEMKQRGLSPLCGAPMFIRQAYNHPGNDDPSRATVYYLDPIGRVFRCLFNGDEENLIGYFDYVVSEQTNMSKGGRNVAR